MRFRRRPSEPEPVPPGIEAAERVMATVDRLKPVIHQLQVLIWEERNRGGDR